MKNPFPAPITPTWLIHNRLTPHQRDFAAHAINKHEKLVKAVKAYQDLCTCYRIGKQPAEKLFKMLDDAKATLLDED